MSGHASAVVAAVSEATKADSFHIGYAHAFKSPGSLGEHNIETTPDADQLVEHVHRDVPPCRRRDSQLLLRLRAAGKHATAHYDLGAGGRSITTDCHDGSQIAAVNGADGTSQPAGRFVTLRYSAAVSAGMTYKF